MKRHWDDECVVYCSDARETHLLASPGAQVLEILERGPASSVTLTHGLRVVLGDATDQDAVLLVADIVNSLIEIGLVEVREGAF